MTQNLQNTKANPTQFVGIANNRKQEGVSVVIKSLIMSLVLLIFSFNILKAQAPPAPVVVENTFQGSSNRSVNIRDQIGSISNIIGTINVNECLVGNSFTLGNNYIAGSNGTNTRAWVIVDVPNTQAGGKINAYIIYGSTYTGPLCGVGIVRIRVPVLNFRSGAGTTFANVKKNGVDIVGFQGQCYYIIGSQLVSGVSWYKVQLYTSSTLSQNYAWVSGSSTFVDYLTTGNEALYTPALQGTQNLSNVQLNWDMEGMPKGVATTSFDVLKNFNYNGFNLLGNTYNKNYQDVLQPTTNEYKIKAKYRSCFSNESNTLIYNLNPPCQPSSSNQNVSICKSSTPYNFNGQWLNTSGNYQTTLYNGNYCGKDSTIYLTLDVQELEAPQIIDTQSVYPNTTVWINATQPSGAFSWSWSVYPSNLATILQGNGSPQVQLNIPANASGIFYVTIKAISQNGCESSDVTVPISINLPLNLQKIDLSGIIKNDVGLLKFIVNDNKDVSIYKVYKSINGIDFEPLKEITPNNNLNYTFNDINIKATNYYRVDGVTKNGKIIFSNVVFLENKKSTKTLEFIKFTNGILEINNNSFSSKKYSLSIVNTAGQVICHQNELLQKGINKINIKCINYIAKQYLLASLIDDKGEVFSFKILK